MARARTKEDEGSLDLLLDTVCNAFGGIIFIVLLLAILPAQGTRPSSPATSDAAPSQLAELDRLRAELAHNQRVLELQQKTAGTFALPESADDLVRKAELKDRLRDLQAQAVAQQQNDSHLQETIDAATRDVTRVEELRRRLEIGLLKGQSEHKQGEVRVTRLPRLRGVDKANYFLVVHQSRVYLILKPGRDSLSLYDNSDDFDVTMTREGKRYVPLDKGGVSVADWLQSPSGLARLCEQLPKERFVVNICLYPDSLKDFAAMRNAFTERGYDYNWGAATVDQPLVLVRSSGMSAAQ